MPDAGRLRATTPIEISTNMKTFAASIVGEQNQPFFHPIERNPGASTSNCHVIVQERVEKQGGEPVYCWSLWKFSRFWLEAEFHCVWRDKDGELHDISPDPDQTQRLLVLDPERRYEGTPLPNKFRIVSHNSFAQQAMACYEKISQIRASVPTETPHSDEQIAQLAKLSRDASELVNYAIR